MAQTIGIFWSLAAAALPQPVSVIHPTGPAASSVPPVTSPAAHRIFRLPAV